MGEKMGFERVGELQQVKLGDCLWEVHAAGRKVLEFTGGTEFAEFRDSEVLRSAVRSMLKVMAVRLGEMQRGFPGEFAKIAGADRVMGLMAEGGRPEGEDAKVWRVVEEVVPELVAEVRAVLEEWHQA